APWRPTSRCGGGPPACRDARSSWSPSSAGSPLLAGVVAEGARRGELAQLVPHHGLGHVDGHVATAVVHGDGVTDHVRDDGGAARPGLDDLLVATRVQDVDLLEQMVVDEGSLFQATRHVSSIPRLPPRRPGTG